MVQEIGELLVGAKLIKKTQLAVTRPIQPFASRTPTERRNCCVIRRSSIENGDEIRIRSASRSDDQGGYWVLSPVSSYASSSLIAISHTKKTTYQAPLHQLDVI